MCWLACRTPSSVLPATRNISIHLRLVASNLAYDRLFQQTLFSFSTNQCRFEPNKQVKSNKVFSVKPDQYPIKSGKFK